MICLSFCRKDSQVEVAVNLGEQGKGDNDPVDVDVVSNVYHVRRRSVIWKRPKIMQRDAHDSKLRTEKI